MTGLAPNGTSNPAQWTVAGSGWSTVGTGHTWTVNTPTPKDANLSVVQRGQDQFWLINTGAHSQIVGNFATVTPADDTSNTQEMVFPVVLGPPQATAIYGSSSRTDGGTFGILQPSGLTSQISCSWKFGRGFFPPPPPPAQVVIPGSGSMVKPTGPDGSVFIPITPCRVADTRPTGTRINPRAPSGIYPMAPATIQIAGLSNSCGIPAMGPTAISMNVTAVPIEPLTSMSIRPIGQGFAAVPLLSATDGQATANAVIVPFGSGAMEVSVTNRSHVVIDVNGFFMPMNTPNGNAFYPLRSCRALDTAASGTPLAAAVTRDVDVRTACAIPSFAKAVVINVTVAPQGPLGVLNVWEAGQTMPNTSSINADDGQLKSNMVIAKTSNTGKVSFFASNSTNVTVDVVGFFGAPGAPGSLLFHPLPACVAVDTQLAAGPFGGPALDASSSREFAIGTAGICGVPAFARAYALNFIATPLGPLSELDAQASGPGNGRSWSMYARDGQMTASPGILAAGTGGVVVKPYSPTHLKMIITGFFD